MQLPFPSLEAILRFADWVLGGLKKSCSGPRYLAEQACMLRGMIHVLQAVAMTSKQRDCRHDACEA